MLLVMYALFTSSLNAQIFQASIDGFAGMSLSMNGLSHEWTLLPNATDSGLMNVTLDPIARTLHLISLDVMAAPGTIIFSKQIVTEFGFPAKNITAEITFNAPYLQIRNVGPHRLQQTSDGSFVTERGPLHNFEFELSGAYNIHDGYTMYSGDFGIQHRDASMIDQIPVNLSRYPDQIILGNIGSSPWRYFEYIDLTLFEVEFDDFPVSVGLSTYTIRSENLVTLEQVPEPSFLGMFLGILILFCVLHKKHTRK